LVLLQNNDYHFRLTATQPARGHRVVRLTRRLKGIDTIVGEQIVGSGRLYLKVEACGQAYSFYVTTAPEMWIPVAEEADGRLLSTPVAGGFVGAYIGMYASSNGHPSETVADFAWFEYQGLEAD